MLKNCRDQKNKQKIMWVITYFNLYNTRQKEMGSTNIKFITKEEIENIDLGESI